MKIWKDYRQTNNRQHAQKSPLDLSVQVSQKIFQGNDSYHVIKIIERNTPYFWSMLKENKPVKTLTDLLLHSPKLVTLPDKTPTGL